MEQTATKTYFSALHDETFALLVESRNYIAGLRQRGNEQSRRTTDYLDVTLETMRLTTRLTQVMAWILAQKAVQNAEMTPEEGTSEQYRLSGHSICMDTEPGMAGHLPPNLRELLQRSYDLYCRVNRLEDQIRVRLTEGPQAEPMRPEDGPYLRPVTTSDQNPQNAY